MKTSFTGPVPLTADAISFREGVLQLLMRLIATPSFSGAEDQSAALIGRFLNNHTVRTHSSANNVWAFNKHYSTDKPTILLTAHHDTVRPCRSYTREPFTPELSDGRLYGLGSNDAGGALVALIAVFLHYHNRQGLLFNLCFAAVAEEEVSGDKGLASILSLIGDVHLAIVGAPTNMEMATTEMGDMVLECTTRGAAGHSANGSSPNAVYQALQDIQWFSTYQFPRTPAFLFPIKMTVTGIETDMQQNVVPDECCFTVDIRLNNCYSAEEVLEIINRHTQCEISVKPGTVKPVSVSSIHPIVLAGLSLSLKTTVGKASSDRSLVPCPSITLGPGDPERSHTADEFIFVHEIINGINTYIRLLDRLPGSLVNNLLLDQ